MREWQVKRRERTRQLIELGGLVVKAGLAECNELTVRADLDEDTVYKLTKAFIENLDDIRKGCATWADCTPEKAAKDTGAPMHPGAVRYYKEAGLLK